MCGYGALTLEPRSLKIISTSKILPNCCGRQRGRRRRAEDEEKRRKGEEIIRTW